MRMAAGAACLFLGACSNAVLIGTEDVSQNYRRYEIGLVGTRENQLRLIVAGNRFADSDAFVAEVVSSMTGRTPGLAVNFSANPEREYSGGRFRYNVRMVFDPLPGVSSMGLCRLESLDDISDPAPDPSSRLRVMGALCQGDLTLTRAVGTVAPMQSPSDPAFDQLMVQMTMTLFPITNRNLEEANNGTPRLNLLLTPEVAGRPF